MFVNTKQAPVAGTQQAPSGSGQSVELQSVPFPWKMPPADAHSVGVAGSTQVPSSRQHDPSGKQIVVPHAVPGPENTPPTRPQSVDGKLKQPPVEGMQHAPPALQSVSLHNDPAPCHVPPVFAQSAAAWVLHTPETQHAPSAGGQSTLLHGTLSP